MTSAKPDLREPSNPYQLLGLGITLLLTALIYYPGLGGSFLFDDFFNIVDNPAVYLKQLSFEGLKTAALSSDAGILKRPISMLSFALNGYFGEITPGNLKTVNLFIHLCNGVFIFLLTRLTLQYQNGMFQKSESPWCPLIVASLWLIAPINLTSVLYAVQRMTDLAALFSFAGIYLYFRLRIRQIDGKSNGYRIAACLLLFTIIAALCKENGLLLPLFAGCYELTVLGFKTPNLSEKYKLTVLYFLICIVPAGFLIFTLSLHPEALFGGYESIRDFTLSERLLTESRVLWLYLIWTVLPTPSSLGMYHDDIALSHSLLSPLSTTPALLGLFALLIYAYRIRKKQPFIALGVLLFFAGHSMESTVFPLEIAHEHRNYFPSYGIFLSLVMTVWNILRNRCYPMLATAIVAYLSVTGIRASIWGNSLDQVLMEVQHHPLSARSNYEAARLYMRLMRVESRPEIRKEDYLSAKRLFLKSSELKTTHIAGLLGAIWLDGLYGVIPDKNLIELITNRLSGEKIIPSTSENLSQLHACEMNAICALSGELIYDLQLAAIANPKIPGDTKVSLMSEACVRALKLNRFREAIGIAYDASKYQPDNAQLGLNYAVLLIQAKLYQIAQTELDRIEKLDLDSGMVNQFDRLQADLARLPPDESLTAIQQ